MTGRGMRVVLAGGGTGGHVIPALALASALTERGGAVRFVGTRGRLEERLVPEAGFEIDYIRVRPLVGTSPWARAAGLAAVPFSVARAASLLRGIRPRLVMGVGGYVAGPVVMAAALMGIPTALLEQNATLGLTNRLLSRWVGRAFVAYEEPLRHFPSSTGALMGNPVKPSIVAAAATRAPRATGAPVRLLVMGGSQGARAVDERVPAAIRAAGVGGAVTVVHQCKEALSAMVRAAYAEAGVSAEVVPFISDTATVLARTDLVISRSGATTVSELQVMGIPAIFLPYPHHRDQQQAKNAAPMAAAGAAVVLDETRTGIDALSEAIRGFVVDEARLSAAAAAARRLGRPEAAGDIADSLIAWLERS